jgi:hypothetical protein
MIESSRNTVNGTADAIVRADHLTKVCAGADFRAIGELCLTVTVGDSLALAALFDAASQLVGAGLPLPGLDHGPTSPTPPSRLLEGL